MEHASAVAAISTLYEPNAANYVYKILTGTKPGDLPIAQITKFDFVINLKTASALGVRIPKSILIRANRLID